MAQYLACVPFRVFGFDMEFTGPPAFRADGPTEDIIELGLYAPGRQEVFSCLVQPQRRRPVQEEVVKLTGISNEMLRREGLPFPKAWRRFVEFLHTPEPGEPAGAGDHILLLSHGGKLADQSLIRHTLEQSGLSLPDGVVFGDTIHIIRDAHRRRPVTVDRHPPTWGLSDLVGWLNIPPTLPAHRAGNDAKMTWEVLYHTLLRYGDDSITPKQQLVSRFFDEPAKQAMRHMKSGRGASEEGLGEDDLVQDGRHGDGDVAGEERAGGRLSKAASEAVLLETDFDSIFDDSALAPPQADDVVTLMEEVVQEDEAAEAAAAAGEGERGEDEEGGSRRSSSSSSRHKKKPKPSGSKHKSG